MKKETSDTAWGIKTSTLLLPFTIRSTRKQAIKDYCERRDMTWRQLKSDGYSFVKLALKDHDTSALEDDAEEILRLLAILVDKAKKDKTRPDIDVCGCCYTLPYSQALELIAKHKEVFFK